MASFWISWQRKVVSKLGTFHIGYLSRPDQLAQMSQYRYLNPIKNGLYFDYEMLDEF